MAGVQHPLSARHRNSFADELDGDTPVVMPDNLPVTFDVLSVFAKRPGHHHLLANTETLSGLDIDAAFADVLDRPLKKFPVGREMRLFRTGGPRIDPCFPIVQSAETALEDLIGLGGFFFRGGIAIVRLHFSDPVISRLPGTAFESPSITGYKSKILFVGDDVNTLPVWRRVVC
jgi:hypothetical protein